MEIKNINALVIDDNVFKTNNICKALRENGIRNIISVDNQEDAFKLIYEGAVNLIVTDMHYPVKKGAIADYKSGFIFIERIKKENIDIPIIICSTHNFESTDVAGIVWYSELRDLREDFKEVLENLF